MSSSRVTTRDNGLGSSGSDGFLGGVGLLGFGASGGFLGELADFGSSVTCTILLLSLVVSFFLLLAWDGCAWGSSVGD